MNTSGTTSWDVHKFGGTSVADADRYRHVAQIVRGLPSERRAVVVSAMSKVTDALFRCVELAGKRDDACLEALVAIERRHKEQIRALLPAAEAERLIERIAHDVRDIQDILRAVTLLRSHTEAIDELVSGYGEVWSAQILAAHLQAEGVSCAWLDARKVLVVSDGDLGPNIHWETSRKRLATWLEETKVSLVIITGYVASTPEGVPTTLKRNGSDFSASIFGALLDAAAITIWTDVDGVLSADPRRVPEALVLDHLSYQEAMELAYFGAKVVHPRTMSPAVKGSIPIWIKNTFHPERRGTVIHEARAARPGDLLVKGFSTVDGISLLNVEGTGMIGVPGIAQRLFGALREVSVSVVMISQASSEHSICFAVPDAQGPLAKTTVEKAFFGEIHEGHIQTITVVPHCSVLAAVGDGMVDKPGVAARFFSALGSVGVSVRAVAQGSSERNISAVIDQKDSTRALRAVHAGFTLSDQTLSLGVVGPGLIGRTLLDQLHRQKATLRQQLKLDLRVRAIADSRRMLLVEDSIDLATWRDRLEKEGVAVDLAALARHVRADHLPHAGIVDCSASDAVADSYAAWLGQGIHVVTPNKKAGSGPLARLTAMKAAAAAGRARFLYEATVGAGLPVITTLKDLVQTGDRVVAVEGVLSGTLSYLFNTYGAGMSFAGLVREARQKGYTEPDPRDDLSGLDVARKLMILAREMGRPLELSDVELQSLVPEGLARGGDADTFLEALTRFDAEMAERHAVAAREGMVLRYVGSIPVEGAPRVSLRSVPTHHPFARITGTDNIIAFRTARYDAQPLIVQGPGAGPEVTAGGVFADLLRLATALGGMT